MAVVIGHRARGRRKGCLHTANGRGMIDGMYASTDRLVLVPAAQLDDLCELARLAAERLPSSDPVRSLLGAAAAEVRYGAILEP